ncbi:MAG: branched-chain amino acid ABC transporter permease [Acidimicrobiales bacterium]
MSAYWPFVIIGLFTGSIYGLGAMGVVLTYKTTGVFNFAFGAQAMICGYAYWQFHDSWGLTAWVSLPLLLLIVAPLIGVLFEGVFRRLVGQSAEVGLVISLAMLAMLQAIANIAWGGAEKGLQPVIPKSSFKLASNFYVGWDQLGTLLIAALMGVGLWWLLRHTRFGTATRAVVDNRDLSSMIGVNGGRVRQTAWMISSMFAALVGVLLSPSQGLDPNNLVLVVIAAFAPAVVGRLVSFPWAYGAALAIGVGTSIMGKFSNSGTVANIESSTPWIVLLLALVVLGKRLKESGMAVRPVTASAAAPGAVGSTPSELVASSGRRAVAPSTAIGVSLYAVALFMPLMVSGPKLGDLTAGAIYVVIALTLVVLTGWTGQISLAQFSFVGVGAFTVGHLAGAHGQNFLWATVLSMLFALPLGLILGGISLRLSGLYLALATLAFALIMDGVVFNSVGVSGGLTGILDPRPRIFGINFTSTKAMYELCIVVVGVLIAAAFMLRRGPVGRRLHILRDSPLAASTLGVNLTVTKLAVFAVCAMVAALGGALYGAYQQAITPLDFMWSMSLQLLLLVVLGGRSVITGAVLAGIVYTIQTVHLFPIPAGVETYIPLGVALGVIGLSRNPEGTVALSMMEAQRTMAVLRPRPRLAPGALVGARVGTEAGAQPGGGSDAFANGSAPGHALAGNGDGRTALSGAGRGVSRDG